MAGVVKAAFGAALKYLASFYPSTTRKAFERHLQPHSTPSTLNGLPAELFYCITKHLPPESTQILRQSCSLFWTRIASQKLSKDCQVEYLSILGNDAVKTDQAWAVCRTCALVRPKREFAFTEYPFLASSPNASECLEHSKIWACPHYSCSYDELSTVAARFGFGSVHRWTPTCRESSRCNLEFSHYLNLDRNGIFGETTLQSEVLVMRLDRFFPVDLPIGPEMIGSVFTKERMGQIMSQMRAQICCHVSLSDISVREAFCPLEVEISIVQLAIPSASGPTYRCPRKALHCRLCYKQGVITAFAFCFDVSPSDLPQQMVDVELNVVVFRSLGKLSRFCIEDKDWRLHAMPAERLASLDQSWQAWTNATLEVRGQIGRPPRTIWRRLAEEVDYTEPKEYIVVGSSRSAVQRRRWSP